jgi:hypothetical protein
MKLVLGLALGGAALLTPMGSLAAADFEADFPAGLACDFALHISGSGGTSAVRHDNGTVISAGTGSDLTFTGNDHSLSLRSNGAVTRVTEHGDGSSTRELMGHNVIILFPSDVDGPSVTLVVGRAVVAVGTDDVWEVEQVAGQQTDICAALS